MYSLFATDTIVLRYGRLLALVRRETWFTGKRGHQYVALRWICSRNNERPNEVPSPLHVHAVRAEAWDTRRTAPVVLAC